MIVRPVNSMRIFDVFRVTVFMLCLIGMRRQGLIK